MQAMVEIRPITRPRDDPAVYELETTYRTEQAYRVACNAKGLCLELVDLPQPQEHSFPLDLNEDPWSSGWVAVTEGRVAGFIATAFASWNQRLVIWHFYVARRNRRQGVGRFLMETALAEGARQGAVTAWVETGSSNAPGVEAYRRLGFDLCGFDWTHYRRRGDEFALFLSKEF